MDNRASEHNGAPDAALTSVRRSAMGARMVTAKPQLITFAASHFCEKARWALDWHGIAYEEVG